MEQSVQDTTNEINPELKKLADQHNDLARTIISLRTSLKFLALVPVTGEAVDEMYQCKTFLNTLIKIQDSMAKAIMEQIKNTPKKAE